MKSKRFYIPSILRCDNGQNGQMCLECTENLNTFSYQWLNVRIILFMCHTTCLDIKNMPVPFVSKFSLCTMFMIFHLYFIRKSPNDFHIG